MANVDTGTVTRIDPATNKVIATFLGGTLNEGLAAEGDEIWLAITGRGVVAPIDPATNTVGEGTDTGRTPRRILFRPGELWVSNTDDATISVVPRR